MFIIFHFAYLFTLRSPIFLNFNNMYNCFSFCTERRMNWFYNDTCFFIFILVYLYKIITNRNVRILIPRRISGSKLNVVGSFMRSFLKLSCVKKLHWKTEKSGKNTRNSMALQFLTKSI